MPELNDYEVCFMEHGKPLTLLLTVASCDEISVWFHLAQHLGIQNLDAYGAPLLSHSLRHLVEHRAITNVKVSRTLIPIGASK